MSEYMDSENQLPCTCAGCLIMLACVLLELACLAWVVWMVVR